MELLLAVPNNNKRAELAKETSLRFEDLVEDIEQHGDNDDRDYVNRNNRSTPGGAGSELMSRLRTRRTIQKGLRNDSRNVNATHEFGGSRHYPRGRRKYRREMARTLWSSEYEAARIIKGGF